MRKLEEQEELKRQQEEERLKRLTKELEQHVDPGSLTRSQKDSKLQHLTVSFSSLLTYYSKGVQRT